MLSSDIANKIRLIELHTRRLLSGMLVGDYSTALKGSGFEFDQIREYQEGDDIRFIDWNSSARMNKLLVRQYLEERNRTIFLVVDARPSTMYGSTEWLKAEIIAQVASILALVADYGKDQVGLLLFSHKEPLFIPAARGRSHVHELMRTVFTYQPETINEPESPDSFKKAIEQLIARSPRNAMVFLISDFIDQSFESPLKIISRLAEVIAVRCLDPLERALPNMGIVHSHDHHEQRSIAFDTTRLQYQFNTMLADRIKQQDAVFKKYGIDCLDITAGNSNIWMGDLINFFKRRMMY